LRQDAARLLPPQFIAAIDAEEAPSVVRPHTAMGVAKAAGDVLSLRAHLRRATNLVAALRGFEAERIVVGREIAAYGQQLGRSSMR
jgi:hypothetical protein